MTIGQISFDLVSSLDIIIVLWSFYAFFMVLALSKDFLGEIASNIFREISTAFLQFNFIALAALSLALAYYAFPTRLPWALGLLLLLFGYGAIKKLRKLHARSAKFNFKKMIQSNLLSFSTMVLFFCIVLILFGSDERFLLPSFIIGCIAIAIYIARKEKLKIGKLDFGQDAE